MQIAKEQISNLKKKLIMEENAKGVLRSKISHNEISPKTKEQVKPKRKISG